jgi:hypothetical protein
MERVEAVALLLSEMRSAGGMRECNRPTGRRSIARRCGNTSPRACPIPRSRPRSMPSSTPPIRATPPSAVPNEWGLPVLSVRGAGPSCRRKRSSQISADCASAACRSCGGPYRTFERTETAKLRCVEVEPRHLPLVDLEPTDCRYPYGGDEEGEAITFCGHPRREGSSYCAPHFDLTRGPGTASERAAGTVSLKLAEAA